MRSLTTSLFAALFALSAATAFAADPAVDDISSPWWDSDHVQLNPSADDDKPTPAPAPAPDTDKDKS